LDKNCTIYKVSNFIGKRWTLPILLEIYKGDKSIRRYSSIKSCVPGITAKLLSLRLKELVAEGMIRKQVDATKFPIICEYSLTQTGKEFIKIIQDMKKWALKWKIKNTVCETTNCKECEVCDI
jgi:DNA-binding HxlR family transcriptional regulator